MVKIRRRIPTTYRPPNTSRIEKNTSCPRPADRKGDDDGATGIRRFRESVGRIESFTGLFHAARSPDRTVAGGGSTKFRNRTRVARTDRVTGACLLIGPRNEGMPD